MYNHSASEFVANFIGDINPVEAGIMRKMGLDEGRHHFIRLERVVVNHSAREGECRLKGVIRSMEYYGLYIKYYIDCMGQVLKVIEKNDGINIYYEGQEVDVGIHPADLMSYEA